MRWLLLLLIGLLPGAPEIRADPAELWTALKAGGTVVLVRHTEAPGGVGDPAGFRLDDCATQRNLSEQGRANARSLGDRFRQHGISVGKVLSSRWCRCKETAALMDLGSVEPTSTFDNAFVLRGQVKELTEGARAIISGWKGPGTLVIVTHGANILPLTGIQPAEGAMVVVVPDPVLDARLRVLGSIAPGR
jgi:phosphohistidine phosphatase SixA